MFSVQRSAGKSAVRGLWSVVLVGLVAATQARSEPSGISLPPLAEVADRDPGLDRWQATGLVPGELPVARRDFGLCLHRQGWSLETRTVTGQPGAAMSLTTWTKGKRRLLLMLWEKELGKTRFSLGEESREKRKEKDE